MMTPKTDPVFGLVTQSSSIDTRMYEDLNEDFEPSFVNVIPRKNKVGKPVDKKFVLQKGKKSRFLRKEGRTIQSLRRGWEDVLKTEEEKISPLVADVFKVDKKVRAEFVHDLKLNMDSIEAFFLKEVAPMELALADALERVRQSLELITESEVESESFDSLRLMFREAIRLKSFDFLCKKLCLSNELKSVLVEKYFRQEAKKL